MLGGAVGKVAGMISPEAIPMASSLAVIGMGAMFAGVIRAPVTSILMIFELTGDYPLILAIMLANLTSHALATRLRKLPIYEALLLQNGINLRRFPILKPTEHWQSLPVNTIATHEIVALEADLLLPDANEQIKAKRFRLYPVLDEAGRYCGMIHRKGIERVLETHPERRVSDLLIDPPVPVVYPDQPVKDVVRKFVETEHTTLPMVSRVDPGRLIGLVTLHDITRQQFMQEDRVN
jgi:CIC family chloride channel protein